MGRQRRPYLPGGIFHLMTRTLRRERRFTAELRSVALSTIAEVLPRSRVRPLAVAIMSNHLHLVVQQGDRPLSALMQPLLQRLARRLQDAQGIDGPVFWRHYASLACLHPDHARNAIVYTHLNPVRAGLCADPLDYPWTSHAMYAREASADLPPELEPLAPFLDPSVALPLFATGPHRTVPLLRDDYLAFVEWRLATGGASAEDDDVTGPLEPTSRPPAGWGRSAWGGTLTPLFHAPAGAHAPIDGVSAQLAPDMATIARSALAAEGTSIPLQAIRGRGGGRERARLRHVVIRRLKVAGYRNVDIARFVDLSESAVSRVICGAVAAG